MTTGIYITMPKENQNTAKVRIDYTDVDADGNENVPLSVELVPGQTSELLHVFDTRRIKITEIE